MSGPFPGSDYVLELSTDGSSYTAYTAHSMSVSPGGGERASGGANVAGREAPYVTAGNKNPGTWTFRVLYTTGAAELWEIARGFYQNKTKVWARYSPEGTASGSDRTVYGPGYITNCPRPEGDASSGDPMAVEFSMMGEDEGDETWP